MNWLLREVVIPIWPNLAASAMVGVPGFVLHHRIINRKNQQRHDQVMASINEGRK